MNSDSSLFDRFLRLPHFACVGKSVAKCRGSWVVGRGRGSWVWVVGVGVGKCRGLKKYRKIDKVKVIEKKK